jgi:hypothetical protein
MFFKGKVLNVLKAGMICRCFNPYVRPFDDKKSFFISDHLESDE